MYIYVAIVDYLRVMVCTTLWRIRTILFFPPRVTRLLPKTFKPSTGT